MGVLEMPMPPSVTKVTKDGVKFIDNCDRVQYTIKELTRAALRDVGKYVCKTFRSQYYGAFRRKKGNVGRFTQYWVRSKQTTPDLQVGLKPNAFYGGFQEFGTSKTPRHGLLKSSVEDNIAQIIEIESQYLSALTSESGGAEQINEADYEGGAE